MSESETELICYRAERSTTDLRVMALARMLEAEGIDKATVIHSVQQTLLDLLLEPDAMSVADKLEILRQGGETFLAIVDEIEDRAVAIERRRAVGLPDSTRN